MFFIKTLNELRLYFLDERCGPPGERSEFWHPGENWPSATRRWDKPVRRADWSLIICAPVQRSHAFQHLSFLGNVAFYFFPLRVFHNLWPAYCFEKKETAKYHCVLQIFVCSIGQRCCGWIPSQMFTLELELTWSREGVSVVCWFLFPVLTKPHEHLVCVTALGWAIHLNLSACMNKINNSTEGLSSICESISVKHCRL